MIIYMGNQPTETRLEGGVGVQHGSLTGACPYTHLRPPLSINTSTWMDAQELNYVGLGSVQARGKRYEVPRAKGGVFVCA